MKKLLLHRAVGAGLLSLFLSLSVHAAPMMYFDFDGDKAADTHASANVGDGFSASLYLSGIDTTHGGIISWGNEIRFDPALLGALSYNVDPIWDVVGGGSNINNVAGTVELLGGTTIAAQTGVIKLADVDFVTLAAGASVLSLDDYFPGSPAFAAVVSFDGHVYDAEISYQSADIQITAVPIPAAAWLFGSGLLALMTGCSNRRSGGHTTAP